MCKAAINLYSDMKLGNQICSKIDPRGFYDPNGNCYKCPGGMNRAITPTSVDNNRACDYKLSCPKGSFFDMRAGGQCWRCPSGYKRTWTPVTASDACATSWFDKKSRATLIRNQAGPATVLATGILDLKLANPITNSINDKLKVNTINKV